MAKFKVLHPWQREKVEKEVKMMLHAHRDCLRNRGIDTTSTSYDVRDGYYGEAFGVMRGLQALGYGTLRGAVNVDEPNNLRFWFDKLAQEVLEEENYNGSNECNICLEKYGKDGAGRKMRR